MPGNARLRIGILGSTGSIGTQTLDVVRRNPSLYEVVFLSSRNSAPLLEQQAIEFRPAFVGLLDRNAAAKLEVRVSAEMRCGEDVNEQLLEQAEVDAVVVAINGFAALRPVLAAVQRNIHLALANKEVLVAASSLVRKELAKSTSMLIPVDSEHNSLFQCMRARPRIDIRRVTITASGGPFLHTPLERFRDISADEACRHPNWSMGSGISVDSATMMNKGLEIIEAAALFDLSPEQIEVLIHPQSIVHGIVEFREGTSLAALYPPDMRVPIAHALDYIRRSKEEGEATEESALSSDSGALGLRLQESGSLEFFSVDYQRYPCLELAYRALRSGGAATTSLNAANEVARNAFLAGQIRFPEIAEVVAASAGHWQSQSAETIEEIVNVDTFTRQRASEEVASLSKESTGKGKLSFH